jgi:hypothetical protein
MYPLTMIKIVLVLLKLNPLKRKRKKLYKKNCKKTQTWVILLQLQQNFNIILMIIKPKLL